MQIPTIFFHWQTPFDIDDDPTVDQESVRYDSNNDANVTNTDDFIWNFGSSTEYPIIASTPGTADEQAVRMASGFLRFSNTTIGQTSNMDFLFFYDIGSGSSITTSTSGTGSGMGVNGTAVNGYQTQDINGNALTSPSVTTAGVINGVNSLAPGREFYLSVTFTKGTSPMASYTHRYRFKK